MNKHFEYRIAIIMLVALALVSVTGIYAYRQFSSVVLTLGKDALPDLRLSTTRSVMNGLSDAENNVKSYNLTNDSLYLRQFLTAIDRTDRSMMRLQELTSGDVLVKLELDSIEFLIGRKVDVLNRWLKLSDPYRADAALNKAILSLQMDADKPQGKKQSKVGEEFTAEEVSRAVQKVKKEEALVERVMRDREMALISENNRITEQIREKFAMLEQQELQRLSVKTENAEVTVQKTNRQMAMFFVAMGIILLVMAFVILRYIQNNNRYRMALQKATQEAEEMARSRERFLANMSHEIRTPMNAIAGFTEQLASSKLDGMQKEQLSMVQRSTDHLLHVINEILDLSKLQSEKLQLEKEGFEIRETVNEAIAILKPLASQKRLETIVNVDDSVPNVLIGDAYRLRQMLLNLVGNAIKFTDSGSVSVLVCRNKDGVIEISVQDTGIGMSEAHTTKVFEEFEQAETGTAKNYGGTGLGLSIVQKLVRLHGGEIDVKSELKKGTTITLRLPYEEGSEADLPASSSVKQISGKAMKGLKVLVVDDELFNRKLLATILQKHGAGFSQAANGKEALDLVDQEDFDLVLMDARMPEMDGLEGAAAIRSLEDEKKRVVPILILSAAVTPEDRENYAAVKINGFLAKPFKENELMESVSSVLETTDSDHLAQMETPASQSEELDFSELMEISGNDEAFFMEMLETFYTGTKKGIQDISEALSAGDGLQAAEHAHRISAPCKHVSAVKLYQDLKILEEDGRRNADLQALVTRFADIESEAERVLEQVDKKLRS